MVWFKSAEAKLKQSIVGIPVSPQETHFTLLSNNRFIVSKIGLLVEPY